jgi:hypothetical protein
MEQTIAPARHRVASLLASIAAIASRLRKSVFARKPFPYSDPDLQQLFSDAIEREMIYRELHFK